MKQLKDGGCAFYYNTTRTLKLMAKNFLLLFPLIIIFSTLKTPPNYSRSSFIWLCIIFYCIAFGLGFGIAMLCAKFSGPSCTIYDQYIVWKESQKSALKIKEQKLFFKDLHGFFIKKEFIPFGKHSFKEKVVYFVMQDSQIPSLFPYFSWMSEQDQNLFIALLTDKGLIPFPEDYKPN